MKELQRVISTIGIVDSTTPVLHAIHRHVGKPAWITPRAHPDA
jgi:hypothetical protein